MARGLVDRPWCCDDICHVTKVGFANDGDGDSDFGEEGRVGDLFDTPFVVKIMKDGGFVGAVGDVTDSARSLIHI